MRKALGIAALTGFAICLPGPIFSQDTAVPDGFLLVKDVIPTIVLDIRYAGRHNFIGRPIKGYHAPNAYLTREAADALAKVQEELLTMGLSIKIYDSYRPQRAVDHFIAWAMDLSDTAIKEEFYPGVAKTDLFSEGYISERSSHTRGSTLDLTIVAYPLRAYNSGTLSCT